MTIAAPPETPPAWNADARSRAQTRALLMALARDRTGHRPKLSERLYVYIATFGTLPFLEPTRLFVSQERLEWSLMQEVSQWFASFMPMRTVEETQVKAAALQRQAVRPRWRLCVAIVVAAAIAGLLFTVESPRVAPVRFGWMLFLLAVTALWLLQSFMLLAHRARMNGWLATLNAAFVVAEFRRVQRFHRRLIFFGLIALALGITQLVTIWPIVLFLIVMARLMLFEHWNEQRTMNRQLIERMLESMDDSGLPMEYDVVALNPDEIAAMIG